MNRNTFGERYAPQTTKDFLFEDDHVKSCIQAYASGTLRTHLLLHGPPGTGKSTLAVMIAKETHSDYEILVAADMVKQLKSELHKMENAGTWRNLFGDGADRSIRIYEEMGAAGKDLSSFWIKLDKLKWDFTAIFTSNQPMDIPQQIRSRCRELKIEAVSAATFLPWAMKIMHAEGFTEIGEKNVLAVLAEEERKRDNRRYYDVLELLCAKLRQGYSLPEPVSSTPLPSPKKPNLKVVKQ